MTEKEILNIDKPGGEDMVSVPVFAIPSGKEGRFARVFLEAYGVIPETLADIEEDGLELVNTPDFNILVVPENQINEAVAKGEAAMALVPNRLEAPWISTMVRNLGKASLVDPSLGEVNWFLVENSTKMREQGALAAFNRFAQEYIWLNPNRFTSVKPGKSSDGLDSAHNRNVVPIRYVA